MRTLYYRVTAARVWRSAGGYAWEAHLLIQGQGTVVKGTIAAAAELPAALQSAIAARYLKITGETLPTIDGQLPLL